jgi:hypothetical protein
VSGQTAPAPAAGTKSVLERLHSAGNNGWSDAAGKRDALRLLGELRAATPQVDAVFAASYMLGMGGISADAAGSALRRPAGPRFSFCGGLRGAGPSAGWPTPVLAVSTVLGE